MPVFVASLWCESVVLTWLRVRFEGSTLLAICGTARTTCSPGAGASAGSAGLAVNVLIGYRWNLSGRRGVARAAPRPDLVPRGGRCVSPRAGRETGPRSRKRLTREQRPVALAVRF